MEMENPMRRQYSGMVFIFMAGLSSFAGAKGPPVCKTITDMAGRCLSVPCDIARVYSINPVGTIFLYTLAPEKMIGWNYPLPPQAGRYILPPFRSLPVLGSILGRSTGANPEEILTHRPDLILFMGEIDSFSISSVERIQSQMRIPVVVLDNRLEKSEAAYRLAGDLLDRKDRARELGDYCRKTITEAESHLKKLPADQRIRVYYAEGPDGLATDPAGSPHMQVLRLAGGVNVFDEPVQGGFGRSRVSLEQVLTWNPDVVLVGYDKGHTGGLLEVIRRDPRWRNLPAVGRGRVYQIPACPFSWFDRPPSVNRLIGIRWLMHLFYPASTPAPAAEIKIFYAKFYHYTLTDQEIKAVLE
jgi:iron complex transport system substrate-binding protein